MKKLSALFLVSTMFVFISFSSVIFAQDKSKKPDNSKAELQERVNKLSAEKEAIDALKRQLTKRKAAYDNKCMGKNFNPYSEKDKQIAKECQEESEALVSSQKSLKERQQKYDKNFALLKSNIEAFKATNAAKLQERGSALNEAKKPASKSLQERSDALNKENKNIKALKADAKKKLEALNDKCSEKAFNLLMGEQAEQKYNECNKDKNELMAVRQEIAKRETKYNAEYKQFISDLNASKGKKN